MENKPEDQTINKLRSNDEMRQNQHIVSTLNSGNVTFQHTVNANNSYAPPNFNERIVEKTGHRNVIFSKIPQRSWRYIQDVVTTLVEQKWYYTFTMFTLSYLLSWLLFAMLWYLIGYAHGDLFFDSETGERLSDGKDVCVTRAHNFPGFFIYSVETQVSIGYGEKSPTEECPEGIFLLVAQIIIGICIEGAMVGIIYAKVSRPPKEAKKIMFSKNAVICQRNGNLCLLFRICDPTEQQTIGAKIRAYYFAEKTTEEGEFLGKTSKELKLENGGTAFMMWPVIINHKIDYRSPLYKLSQESMYTQQFEIVVCLVGTSPSTGQLTQARTSYLPSEILWGQQFSNIIRYSSTRQSYYIDFQRFDRTLPVR